jgi:hypothetical protein
MSAPEPSDGLTRLEELISPNLHLNIDAASRASRVGWGAGADLAGVLGEGDIAEVVQRLDTPVASHVVGQAGGACPSGGEAGDRIHRHGAPAAAGKGAAPGG